MSAANEIARAAELLKSGDVVAIPTETVYGLGADASNPAAVRKIFALKGRPADHPLIVHLFNTEQLPRWAHEIPDTARVLADAFWPGPLTIILKKTVAVPLEVTGGLETVGLRVPAHPVARDVLCLFGGGIAAPSANRFGRVSPTTAQHVREEFGTELPLVLDGGPCDVGVESTIVDLSSNDPAILRPGGITQEQLEFLLKCPVPFRTPGAVRAPGTLEAHYAPHTNVILCSADELSARLEALHARGLSIAVVSWKKPESAPASVKFIELPPSVEGQAREIYAALRQTDKLKCDVALVTLPRSEGLGAAVIDRLTRAAAAVRD